MCILPPHLEHSRRAFFQTFLINFAQLMSLDLCHLLSSPVEQSVSRAGGLSLSPGTMRCLDALD
jgi:hypothetical protein